MYKYKREFIKAFVLGCMIFIVLQLISLAFGAELKWDYEMKLNFLYTMMYSVSIYFANACVFIMLDRYYKHDRFSKKRLAVGFISSFLATVVMIFIMRIITRVW